MAALVTGADPIEFLGSTGDELWIRSAVYRKAAEYDFERRLDELKVLIDVLVKTRF